ncbi:MAG: STN domain-containing protein, partial [Bacteroidales bacterium]|nr:STN domain-containing protein [Bacteroidales bacterium]
MKCPKLIIFLLLLMALTLSQRTYAQTFNPLISFSVESCTLDKALEKLFAEYELNVAFSKAEMSKIRIESYSCSYKSVEDVLADLLKGTGYGFKKIGKQYVIRKNQQIVNEPEATLSPPVEPIAEIIKPKRDTVVSPTGDTIRIFDTMQVIRTVMRYDTVVKMKVLHDTVRTIVHEGWTIPWPKFRDNGWFMGVSVAVSPTSFKYENDFLEIENGMMSVVPIPGYCVGLDGGYKHNRLSVGMNVSYRSVRYRFLLEKTDFFGDYYVNDTLDTYYVVHPAGDTAYHYILDSTYIPLTTTNYAYRDVNRLDYLNVGLFAAFDFVKLEHFRAFVKAGASIDILVNYAGSLNAPESPYHAPIVKEQIEPIRFSYYGGLGLALKVANRIELVPEVHYRMTNGSL